MQPSLEDIQQALNKGCQLVVEVSKGVHQWGQDRSFTMGIPSSPGRASQTLIVPGLAFAVGKLTKMCCFP